MKIFLSPSRARKAALVALPALTFSVAGCQAGAGATPAPSAADRDAASHASKGKIPGYAYGSRALRKSPVTLDQLGHLQASMLFGENDIKALRMSRDVLAPHVDEILDVWYGFVGSNPHLLAYFSDPTTGEPDAAYLAAVRKRFGRWILDTAEADYNQDWLDWQYEIGLRHHSAKKNQTDNGKGPEIVHFSHMVALTIPVTTTLRPFLERAGHTPEEVEQMHQAWVKSVLLQSILWSHPYINEGEF